MNPFEFTIDVYRYADDLLRAQGAGYPFSVVKTNKNKMSVVWCENSGDEPFPMVVPAALFTSLVLKG